MLSVHPSPSSEPASRFSSLCLVIVSVTYYDDHALLTCTYYGQRRSKIQEQKAAEEEEEEQEQEGEQKVVIEEHRHSGVHIARNPKGDALVTRSLSPADGLVPGGFTWDSSPLRITSHTDSNCEPQDPVEYRIFNPFM